MLIFDHPFTLKCCFLMEHLDLQKSIFEGYKLDIHACKDYPEMKLQLEEIQDFPAKSASDVFVPLMCQVYGVRSVEWHPSITLLSYIYVYRKL